MDDVTQTPDFDRELTCPVETCRDVFPDSESLREHMSDAADQPDHAAFLRQMRGEA